MEVTKYNKSGTPQYNLEPQVFYLSIFSFWFAINLSTFKKKMILFNHVKCTMHINCFIRGKVFLNTLIFN